jgi:thiol-disulfide isomerase/thioredoxin
MFNCSMFNCSVFKKTLPMHKLFPLFALALLLSGVCPAQNWQYSLQLKDLQQRETVQFGYWYTGIPYLLDSVMVDSTQPTATFKGSRTLEPGLYFFNVKGKEKPLEFVINNEPQIAFYSRMTALPDSFDLLSASKENEPFFYWRTYRQIREIRIAGMRSTLDLLSRATRDRKVVEEHAKNIRALREEIDNNTRKQVLKYPDLLFPKLIICELPAEVPPSIEPFDAEGKPNPGYMVYFREHFWDTYDFKDNRLLRSPALARKTDDWMQIQQSSLDSVKVSLALAVKKANVNPLARQKLLQLMLERFDIPSFGGNESMLVHLFDHHMPSATYVGIDTATWMRVEYKANSYRATLPGRIAPEIRLPDTAGVEVSLYDFKAKYTLVYFFSPLCAHCKEATPKIYEASQAFADKGVRVFAVTTDGKVDYWKDYVATHLPKWTCVADRNDPSPVEKIYSTHALPNVLLLDENKKILIRRLPPERVAEVLQNLR